MGVHSGHHCPHCHKVPVPRCVDLGHMYNCPRHPEVYCLDEDGKACVLCKEFHKRKDREIQEENRIFQEAIVAAALAKRGETCKAGKAQWGNKLPTAGKLARTAALKAWEVSKAADAGKIQNGKADWKGAKGANIAKFAAAPNVNDEKTLQAEGKAKGKPRLRIQRGR